MHQYMNTPQAAAYLGVSISLLERLRQVRQGPAFVRIGRCVRYRREDLDNFTSRARDQHRDDEQEFIAQSKQGASRGI